MKLSQIAAEVRRLVDDAGREVFLSGRGCFQLRNGDGWDDENNLYCWLVSRRARNGGGYRLQLDGHNLLALDNATGGPCRWRNFYANRTAWRRATILRRMLVREFNLLKAVIS